MRARKEFATEAEEKAHQEKLEKDREKRKANKPIWRPVANKLRQLRLNYKDKDGNGISQGKLAKLLKPYLTEIVEFEDGAREVSRYVLDGKTGSDTIGNLERAERNLTKHMAKAYCEFFGVGLEFLYDVTDKDIENTYGLNDKSLGVLSTAVYKMAEAEEIREEYLLTQLLGEGSDTLDKFLETNFVNQHANTIRGVNLLLDQDFIPSEVRVLDALMNFINADETNLTELTNALYALRSRELGKKLLK